MRKIILALLVLSLNLIRSQDGLSASFDYTKELATSIKTPVSPEAQAFSVFGDVPVNTYTGQLNYSLPLDTYKGYEMSLPLNLSYNPGIRVSQLATGAGLGWNLYVGGRITRVVNGLPDNGVPESIFDSSARNKLLDYYGAANNYQTIDDAWDAYYFLRDIRDNKIDVFPDYYQLNVMGLNETIVFDVAGNLQPKVVSNPRIKVTATIPSSGNLDIANWVITAEDGTQYFFDKAETTYREADDSGDNNSAQLYYSSWVLTKVISPNNLDIYTFAYENQDYSSEISSIFEYQTASTALKQFQTNYGVDNLSSHIPDVRIQQQFLKQIFHNGRLIYDIDLQTRYDYWQKHTDNSTFSRVKNRLSTIRRYQYDSQTQINELILSIQFHHTYFGSSGYANQPSNVSKSDHHMIRLKLDQIDFKAADGEILNNYRFEYYNPENLPSRRSLSRDYLGYYNGAANSVLYPKVEMEGINMPGANREVNPFVSSIGSLKRIIYPTGGYSEFSYENHRVSRNISLEPEILGVISASGGTSDFPCNGLCLDKYVEPPVVKSKMVYIPEGAFDIQMEKSGFDQGNGTSNGFEVWVIKRETNQAIYDGFIGAGGSVMPNSSFAWSRSYGNQFSERRQFEAGYYQLTVVNSIIGTNIELSIVDDNYNETELVQEPVPGLRIKSISSYDKSEELISTKKYRYTEYLNSELSSGRELFRPSLVDFVTAERFDANTGSFTKTNRVIRRSGATESSQGHIVYSTVFEINESNSNAQGQNTCEERTNPPNVPEEITESNGAATFFPVTITNGYVETNYNVGVDGIVPESNAPYHNNYVSDYKIGKPKNVKIYDACKKLLQKTTYTYDSAPVFSSPGLTVTNNENNRYNYLMYLQSENGYVYSTMVPGTLSCLGNGCTDQVIYEYAGLPYVCTTQNPAHRPANFIECNGDKTAAMMQARGKSVNGRIGFLTSEVQVSYFDTDSITSERYYNYDEMSDYLLREKETKLSESETIKEVYYYPKDVLNYNLPDNTIFNIDEYSAVQNLWSQNKKGIPIQIDFYKNGQRATSKVTSYQYTQGSTYLKDIKIAKGTLSYEPRIEFLEYSSKGKPILVGIDKQKLLKYEYGYEGKYLVQEVKGIPYNNTLSGNLDTDFILNNYPQVQVVTYKYDVLGNLEEVMEPSGRITKYKYDKFYRLLKVEDEEGNILTENEYRYKQ